MLIKCVIAVFALAVLPQTALSHEDHNPLFSKGDGRAYGYGIMVPCGKPDHDCRKPNKPAKPTEPFCVTTRSCSEWEISSYRLEIEAYNQEVETYNYQVDQYVDCINDFIDKQKEAAEVHLEAAREARND